MKKLISFITILLIINCGDESKNTDWGIDSSNLPPNENKGDWIILHELGDPDKLHPIVSTGASSTYIESMIFQTLMETDNETLELVPVLADGFPEISDDRLSYTYKIRKDAYFSDGTPITGESFIFSLKAIKNPFSDSAPSRNYYKDVQKAELVNGDPYKIKFTCSDVYFKHDLFIGSNLYAFPKHIYDPNGYMDEYTFSELDKLLLDSEEKDAIEFNKTPAFLFAEYFNSTEVGRNPIGSGPYLFKSWVTDDRITLERNHDYWGDKVAGKE